MEELKEISTEVLLMKLDREIDAKCSEIKEKRKEKMYRKIFFLGCAIIPIAFFMQIFFSILNISWIAVIFVYQSLALILMLPVLNNVFRSEMPVKKIIKNY